MTDFVVDDLVEARFQGGPTYYKGRIKDKFPGPRFAIDYDDGDKESSVDPRHIRLQPQVALATFKDSRFARDLRSKFATVTTITEGQFKTFLRQIKPTVRIVELNALIEAYRSGTLVDARRFYNDLGIDSSSGGGSGFGSDSANSVAEDLRRRIKDAVSSSTTSLSAVFDAIDKDKNGTVSRSELEAALRDLNLSVTSRELDAIMDRFDKTGRGSFAYRDFVDFIDGRSGSSDTPTARLAPLRPIGGGGGRRSFATAEVEDAARRLRDRIQDAVKGKGITYEAVFTAIDKDKDGTVSESELESALRELNIDVRRDEVPMLMQKFDKENRGKFAYRDFVSFCRETDSGSGSRRGSVPGRFSSTQVEEAASNLRRQIGEAVRSKGVPYDSIFKAMDSDGDGTVSKYELEKALSQLNINLRGEEVDMLMQKFDKRNRGTFDYLEFKSFCEEDSSFGSRSSTRVEPIGGRRRSFATAEVEDAARRLRDRIQDAVKGKGITYEAVFTAIDKDKDGTVSESELESALRELNIDVRRDEVPMLMQKFDKENRGKFAYRDFVSFCRETDSGSGPGRFSSTQVEEAASNLRRQIGEAVRSKGVPYDSIFKAMDSDGDGTVSKYELEKALSQLNINLRGEEVDMLMQKFDKRNRGTFDYLEFKSFCEEDSSFGSRSSTRVDPIGRGGGGGGGSSYSTAEVDRAVRTLRQRFQDAVERRNTTYEKIFEAMDRNRDGSINGRELESALRDLNITLMPSEVSMVMQRFDPSNRGEFRYRDFADFCRRDAYQEARSSYSSREVDEAANRLRLRITDAVRSRRTTLQRVFETMDRDRSGTVSLRELEDALADLDIRLPRDDLYKLMYKFDPSGRTEFNYRSFVDFCSESSQPSTGYSSSQFTTAEVEGAANRIRSMFRDAVERRGVTYEAVFSAIDRDRNGSVSPSELNTALRDLRIDLSPNEERMLMQKFDPSNRNEFSYRDFLAFVREGDRSTSSGAYGSSSSTPAYSTREVEDAAQRIRSMFRDAVRRNRTTYERVFEVMDSNRDGTVSPSELNRALRDININLSAAEERMLMQKFDPRNRGSFDYRDFVEFCQEGGRRTAAPTYSSAEVEAVATNIRQRFRDAVQQRRTTYEEVFRAIDRNGDGHVSHQELHGALLDLNLSLRLEDEEMLMQKFDVHGRGSFNYRDFIEFCRQADVPSYNYSSSEVDAAASRIRAMIRNAAETRGVSYDKVFSTIDQDRNGYVTPDELNRAIQDLSIYLQPQERDMLMQKFDKRRQGRFDYQDFIAFLREPDSRRSYAPEEVEAAAHKIRSMIRTAVETRGVTYEKVFRTMDTDGNGYVSENELSRALQDISIYLQPDERRMLMQKFDPQGRGQFNYRDFVDFCNAAAGPGPRDVAYSQEHIREVMNRLRRRIRAAVDERRTTYAAVFEAMDTNRDRMISREELATALRDIDIVLSPEELSVVMAEFDKDRSGTVEYRELVDFCAQLDRVPPRQDIEQLHEVGVAGSRLLPQSRLHCPFFYPW